MKKIIYRCPRCGFEWTDKMDDDQVVITGPGVPGGHATFQDAIKDGYHKVHSFYGRCPSCHHRKCNAVKITQHKVEIYN